jgi:hypothetical protein
VDFCIDFINKMLIIRSTIEREPEESAMSELGIYEGCYVELRNGDVVGPVKRSEGDMGWPWHIKEGVPCWTDEGFIGFHDLPSPEDIVRVIDSADMVSVPPSDRSEAPQGVVSTIPPHVTKAAMDAGIKAEPAYEQFVNAILTAGFKAQYGIGFVPVAQPVPIDMDELCERLASALPVPRPLSECSDEMKEKLRKIAEAAVSYLSEPTGYPENESEKRISDSEKPKGGLSGLPLEGVTICFTGSMNTPVDTHKGIAEALGAKVSGSVHSNTTLVVLGVGALSKLDKAIELDLPRISESGWMWMARLVAAKLGNESERRFCLFEKPKGGLSSIPSVREIHDQVLAEVTDWRAKYGRDSMPSTFSIAQAFHRMLTPVATEEQVNLVAPEGWYLYECKHEHTAHRFANQIVTPSDHPGGSWCVDFQRLGNGGRLTGGRGKTLVDAWQNAVAAIKLAEEHGLDI